MSLAPLALLVVGWIFSLCLHEFAHALVAYLGGDRSVKDKGYLSFNPAAYTDPFLSIVFPIIFLVAGGLALPGGCVYVDRTALKSRLWECAVSLAGPLANLLFFGVLALPFLLGLAPVGDANHHWAWDVYAALAALQIMAVALNLIPIPPLDGYGALAPLLPDDLRSALDSASSFGMWIVFLLMLGGGFSHVVLPLLKIALPLAGIPGDWVAHGLQMCRPF